MKSLFHRGGVCFLSVLLAAPAWSYPNPRNPDRRPSFGFQAGGSAGTHVTEDVSNPQASVQLEGAQHSANFQMDLNLPFADAWSLQMIGGLNSLQTSTDEFLILPGTSVDAPSAGGSLTLRHYFLDHSWLPVGAEKNPDRWPSLGFTGGGTATLYRDEIDILFGFAGLNPIGDVEQYNGAGDLRLPLSNSWTLLANLSGNFLITIADETPSASGNEVRVQYLEYGGGARYYWVGRNLISKDQHINPDAWSSVSLTGQGIRSIGGQQDITSQGLTFERGVDISGFEIDSELRLPITNYFTFRLGVGGGILRLDVPPTPVLLGVKSTDPTINGFVGFRHYFR